MTVNEAILYIKKWYQPTTEPKEREKSIEALSVVLKCVKEIQKYREIGTVEECREAMEKQKEKKPIDIEHDYSCFTCPNCGAEIYTIDDFRDHNYCLNCGQAISWKESEEE